MVPGKDGGQTPIILSLVISLLESVPVWVIESHRDRLLSRLHIDLPRLVVDSRVVDGSCVLCCGLILILIVNHVIFHGLGQFPWHERLASVLSKEKLTKTNGGRDLALEAKLDQVERVESWEIRIICLHV